MHAFDAQKGQLVNRMIRTSSTTPRKVVFADEADIKACSTCSAAFSIVCLKHNCRKCNKVFCGKCSKSNVTAINNSLFRERLCLGCVDLPSRSADPSNHASVFTPSKLNMLNSSGGKSGATGLWSADTDSDSESDVGDRSFSVELVKENLTSVIADDVVNVCQSSFKETASMTKPPRYTPSTSGRDHHGPLEIPEQSRDEFLQSLCDASFSDTQSAASSVSSKATALSGRSPGATAGCFQCKTDLAQNEKRHFCTQCYRVVCSSCSTVNLSTVSNTIVRSRVCSLCVGAVAGGDFTPSKLHLLNQVGSTGSRPSGQRNVTSRLWSADTETDSDDSGVSGELNLSADSMTENLMDVIQEATEPVAAVQQPSHASQDDPQSDEEEEEFLAGEDLFHAEDVASHSSAAEDASSSWDANDHPTEDLHDCSTASFDSDASGSTGCAIYPEARDASCTSLSPLPQGRPRSNSLLIVLFTAAVMLLLSGLLPQLPLIVTSAPMNLQELHDGSQYHIDLADSRAVAGIQLAEADHPAGEILVKEVMSDSSPTETLSSGEFVYVTPGDAVSVEQSPPLAAAIESAERAPVDDVSASQLQTPVSVKPILVTAQFGRKLRDAFSVYRRRLFEAVANFGNSVMTMLARFRFRL